MASTASGGAVGGSVTSSNGLNSPSTQTAAGKPPAKPGRSSAPQKAWSSSTNSPVQKSSGNNQLNGAGNVQHKVQTRTAPKETTTPDRHAHDRLTWGFASFVGLRALVTAKDGNKFDGIFSGSSTESNDASVTLKMTKQVHTAAGEQANGIPHSSDASYKGSAPDFAWTIDMKDVAAITVPGVLPPEPVRSANGVSSSFRTDTEISGNVNKAERVLQPWVSDPATDVDLSLESGAGNQQWDQFETNKNLFGAESTYNEDIYTTRIDRSDPSYKRREAEAVRIAREIEGSATTNMHLREERGQAMEQDGEDEEAKYSGVRQDDFPPLSSGQPNKYTPPARRAPTGQPTVSGVPVDPAIISATMSRADGKPKAQPKPDPDNEPPTSDTKPKASNQNDSEASTLSVLPKKGAAEESRIGSASASPQRKAGEAQNATEGVESEVLDHFREFAKQEKAKIHERRRVQASNDKSAKIAELKKFSKNFRLDTPVPTDLVPILAKDRNKQEQIVEKANRQRDEKLATSAPSQPKGADVRPPVVAPGNAKPEAVAGPAVDRQNTARARQGFPPTGPFATREKSIQSQGLHTSRNSHLLSHRLTDIQRERKAGMAMPHNVAAPIPITDMRVPPPVMVDNSGFSSPQRQSAVQTPTSAMSSKFNVSAASFKPNPAASSFNPGGASTRNSSPQSAARTRSISRAQSPTAFFGTRKPNSSERRSIATVFNSIKRVKKDLEAQNKQKEFSFNGGIPQAYRTPPIWDDVVRDENKEKTYVEAFDRDLLGRPPAMSPAVSNHSTPASQMPHAHQLPYHLQNGGHHSHMQAPHPAPHNMHGQHQQAPFEDHHRMGVPGVHPHAYPSPRLQQSPMVYPSPMGHQAQIYGQPMPQFYAPPGAPQQISRMQYPGSGQFMHGQPGQVAGPPMMVQQTSNGPFMNMPQQFPQPMYSPSPSHAYPHMSQANGYPSPSRGAPMMMHQGSQQGHHPQNMSYGQPVYATQQGHMPAMRPAYSQQPPSYSSSPLQPHAYPPQPHRAPSSGYGNSYSAINSTSLAASVTEVLAAFCKAHWRYISSYHGPWLQLPPEILQSLAQNNYQSPRPRPIDPAVFFDLVKIRRQIEEATTLAVRAANGTTSSSLTNSLNASNGLLHGGSAAALGLGISGGSANAKLSRERKYRMREHATQKLSHAYHLDEIAASVATMQSASALEEVAKHVLQRNKDDPDAKYVHFFHEKIPSRALAECTSLQPLDEIITQRPTEGAPFRTRAVTRIFKDDYVGAAKDLTDGLSVCRLYDSQHLTKEQEPSIPKEPIRRDGTNRADSKLNDQDQPSSLEPQLLFHRAGAYLTIACDYIDTALNGMKELKVENGHVEADTQSEVVQQSLEARKLVRGNAKRALRDYVSFLSHFEYSPDVSKDMTEDYFRKVNSIANGYPRTKIGDRRLPDHANREASSDSLIRVNGHSPRGSPLPSASPSIYLLSSLFSAVPPSNLPPYPSEDTSLIAVRKPSNQYTPEPSTFHETVTYHPLLTDALHSLLLCHILVQTSTKEHLRHAHMVARIARVCDGYPIFLAARSPARADWMEVLRRANNWIGLRAGWETLCQPAPLPGQTSDDGRLKVDKGQEGMSVEEKRRHEAVMDALSDDRVQTDEALRASVRARELRAAREEEEEQRKEYLRSASHLTRAKQGNVSPNGRSIEQDGPRRWAQEDGKEYPISTERAEALARWIKEAPPPGELEGGGKKNRSKAKSRKKGNAFESMEKIEGLVVS
ncbi:MAG: hypothetical protein Q9227_006448 [Pyrenula ochraceoflavens]